MHQKINWPWFSLGCVLLVASLGAFFWGFAIGKLTPSQWSLLMWLLPLSSGFSCGCFAGASRVAGTFGSLAIVATGGFAVWLLSYWLIPEPALQMPRELLMDRIQNTRTVIAEQSHVVDNKREFKMAETILNQHLDQLEQAVIHDDFIRVHDGTKMLMETLESDVVKKGLPPDSIPLIKFSFSTNKNRPKRK